MGGRTARHDEQLDHGDPVRLGSPVPQVRRAVAAKVLARIDRLAKGGGGGLGGGEGVDDALWRLGDVTPPVEDKRLDGVGAVDWALIRPGKTAKEDNHENIIPRQAPATGRTFTHTPTPSAGHI